MPFSKKAVELWRDFVTSFDPFSDAYQPEKPLIRQWGTEIEDQLAALAAAAGFNPDLLKDLTSQSYVGELLRSASTSGAAANGGVLQTDGPQIIGLAIPAGATASGSYVRHTLPLGPGEIAGLSGRTIRMVALAEITPGFTDAHPLTGEPASIVDDTGFHQGGTVVNAAPVGDRLAYTIDYTVTGRERSISITIALAAGSGATSGQSFYVRSLTYRVVADPLPSALGIGGATVPYSRSALAAEPSGIGIEISDLSFNPSFVNGGAVSAYRGRPLGIAVPAGQTGRTSYVEYVAPLDPSDLAVLRGSFVRVAMGFDTSAADFSLPLTAAVKFDATGSVPGGQIIRFAGQYRQFFYLVVIDTWVPDSAQDLRGTIQIADTGTTASADLFVRLREIDARVLIPRGGVSLGHPYTGADLTARLRASRLMRKAAARAALGVTALRQATDTALVLSVDIGGLGDAISAADTRGVGERFQIQVPRGIFTGAGNFDTHLPDHVDLQGWDSSASRIVGYQTPDTPLSDVAAKSTLNKEASGRIAGLRVTAENCRYVLHNDFSSPVFGRGIKQVIEDCHLEHLGNDEVRAYQTANGGDASAVWRSTAAVGYGLGDGGELVVRRCTIKGKDFTAMTGHDGPGFSYAPRMIVEDCTLTPQRDPTLELGWSFLYGLLGSGQSTVISMSGNTLPNPIVLNIGSWQITDPSNQLADKIGGLIWRGSGNTPTPYLLVNEGSAALRIDALAAGAPLSVSGSAVALIFGDPIAVREAPGLPGGAYGTWDVGEHQIGAASNIANPSLGARLGDRRGNPATLTVASGSSSATITFNQNYTSASNASILSVINGAISAFAIASLFVVNDLFRPHFTDEETELVNTGSTTILRKSGVAYDNAVSTGRVMTADDPLVAFAGVALQTIRPGQSGRVKTGGAMRVSQDLLRSDSGTFQLGTTFGIGSTPGRFVLNPTTALLRATNTRDVGFLRGGGGAGPPGPPPTDAQIAAAYVAWASNLPVYSGTGDAPVPPGQAYNMGAGGPVVIAQQ